MKAKKYKSNTEETDCKGREDRKKKKKKCMANRPRKKYSAFRETGRTNSSIQRTDSKWK